MEGRPSAIESVQVPHPGMSYNPTFGDHQVYTLALCTCHSMAGIDVEGGGTIVMSPFVLCVLGCSLLKLLNFFVSPITFFCMVNS